jgi:hypothetical protein
MKKRLGDYCKLIRSKNAGPFMITFDFMFDGADSYRRCIDEKWLTPQLFVDVYGVQLSEVMFFECEDITSIKVSFPRPVGQGDLGDSDMHGGQMFGPLAGMLV